MKLRHRSVISAAVVFVCAVAAFAQALPEIRITTTSGQDPQRGTAASGQARGCSYGNVYNHRYIEMSSFAVTNAANSAHNVTIAVATDSDSIRLRGNSSANVAKLSYRIKFDRRHSLFGRERSRSWVLLANHYDTTMALNAAAFELGRRLGLDFTPTYQFVNLYLNNSYKGIYLLTEQIQDGPGRIDIDRLRGFAVEFDYHCPDDNDIAWMTRFTHNGRPDSLHTFAVSPDVDAPPFTVNNELIAFVPGQLQAIVNTMFDNARFASGEWRDSVDVTSFVKYIMIQQFMDNFDFNSKTQPGGLPGSNFAYREFGERLKAGPLWDFDLSAGVPNPGMNMMNWPRYFTSHTDSLMPRHNFYRRFFEDDVFRARWRKTWDAHRSDFEQIGREGGFIDSIYNLLAPSIQNNFAAICVPPQFGWGPCQPMNYTQQNYRNVTNNLKNWWRSRFTFFEQEINQLGFDASLDVPDNPLGPPVDPCLADPFAQGCPDPCIANPFAQGCPDPCIANQHLPGCSQSNIAWQSQRRLNGAITVSRSAIRLYVNHRATIGIYSIDGRRIRQVDLRGGDHTVRLNDLGRGVYVLSATVDGRRQVLRVPVR